MYAPGTWLERADHDHRTADQPHDPKALGGGLACQRGADGAHARGAGGGHHCSSLDCLNHWRRPERAEVLHL